MKYNNLLVYIKGNIEEELVKVEQINSYQYPFNDFIQRIEELQATVEDQDIEMFCLLGEEEKIRNTKEKMTKSIQELFNELLNSDINHIMQVLNDGKNNKEEVISKRFFNLYLTSIIQEEKLKYPRMAEMETSDGIVCLVLYFTHSPEEEKETQVSQIMRVFLEREKPFYMGKQIMIQSFLLQDVKDRKILGVLPDMNGSWYVLLEGGIKLHLRNDIPYQREKIGSKDIGRWSLLETDSILHDPCYAYQKFFVPYELFEEWNCVLMYALAVLPIEYEAQKLKLVYREFIKWMEDNVCEVIEVEDNIISEDIFINCILVTIKNIRGYLEGNDELGISKNILILLRSRYAYLPTIYKLISQYYKEEVLHKAGAIEFSTIKWKELLQEIDKGNCYEKGISLEQIANYFVDCIEGIKVTKRRAKTKNEEMDLVCCNVAENEELWKLGPVVLIECKNWESKVDTKVIRNLSYLMDKKGICTLMLFAKKDITDVARDEILKQAAHNRFILVFTLEDLMKIDNNKMKPIDLLISKLNHLENEIMDAMENFM